MSVTNFFALFYGLLFGILGLLFLARKDLSKMLKEMSKSQDFMLFSGVISLIIGIVTVLLHNIWVMEWPVIITLLGWVSIIKGVMRIGFPEKSKKQLELLIKKKSSLKVMLLLFILLGTWLIWMGV